MRTSTFKTAFAAFIISFAALDSFADNKVTKPSPTVEKKLEKISQIGVDYRPTATVLLYPKGQYRLFYNEEKGFYNYGRRNGASGYEIAGKNGFIANVSDSARIDLYIPAKSNSQMVLVIPGGGYHNLSTWNEGVYVAKWLNDRGISACVLKYRLPNNGHHTVPLTDAQNALKYCRRHAAEYGIDQVGVIGFSAGGHLASCLATMYKDTLTKPDFAALIYPVISMEESLSHKRSRAELLGNAGDTRDDKSFEEWFKIKEELALLERKYSTQNNVCPSTPKVFIALSSDDSTVQPENSLLMYDALYSAGVPCELHAFPRGGHGWGFTTSDIGNDKLAYARNEFSSALERWLETVHKGDKPAMEKQEDRLIHLPKPETVLLYPKGQRVDEGISENGLVLSLGPGADNGCRGPENVNPKNLHTKNVGDSARIRIFLPSGGKAEQLVLICPGGGYWITAQKNEGLYAAKWLLDRGVAAAVLDYRLPMQRSIVPSTDALNALRYLKAKSGLWGVRQVGIMGFSAGGHLAASASTLFTKDSRPDFSILFYPVIAMERGVTHDGTRNNLIGYGDTPDNENLAAKYSLERQVTPQTPPTIIIYSSDDKTVPVMNEIRYYRSLLKNGVRCEMHAYPTGGHGWGFRDRTIGSDIMDAYRDEISVTLKRFLDENACGTYVN